jgi:putative oxidoreductase
MNALSLAPMARLASLAPLAVRVIVGIIMVAHGLQKLTGGPANFGQGLAEMGVPLPVLMAYLVTFVELVGGILLIIGLLSRLAALLLTIPHRGYPAREGQHGPHLLPG